MDTEQSSKGGASNGEHETSSQKPSMGAESKAHDAWSFTDLRTALESGSTIFERLVGEENDVIGLLSYSFAMQNKRDWLAGFVAAKGRTPNTDEIEAYEIGEVIDRRLTTYRKLAENALSGNPIWASTGTTPVSELLPAVPTTGPFPGESPAPPPFPVMPPPASHWGGSRLAIAGGVLAIAMLAVYVAFHVLGIGSV